MGITAANFATSVKLTLSGGKVLITIGTTKILLNNVTTLSAVNSTDFILS